MFNLDANVVEIRLPGRQWRRLEDAHAGGDVDLAAVNEELAPLGDLDAEVGARLQAFVGLGLVLFVFLFLFLLRRRDFFFLFLLRRRHFFNALVMLLRRDWLLVGTKLRERRRNDGDRDAIATVAAVAAVAAGAAAVVVFFGVNDTEGAVATAVIAVASAGGAVTVATVTAMPRIAKSE